MPARPVGPSGKPLTGNDAERRAKRQEHQRIRAKLLYDTEPQIRIEHALRQNRKNAESRSLARRNGQQWTGAELELAARADLTAAEVGVMIGRTILAVQNARFRLRRDPKTIALAGAGSLQHGKELRNGHDQPTTQQQGRDLAAFGGGVGSVATDAKEQASFGDGDGRPVGDVAQMHEGSVSRASSGRTG